MFFGGTLEILNLIINMEKTKAVIITNCKGGNPHNRKLKPFEFG